MVCWLTNSKDKHIFIDLKNRCYRNEPVLYLEYSAVFSAPIYRVKLYRFLKIFFRNARTPLKRLINLCTFQIYRQTDYKPANGHGEL